MAHLSPLSELLLPLGDLGHVMNSIIYVVGVIGVILIIIFLIGAILMIPDLLRYMKIKSM